MASVGGVSCDFVHRRRVASPQTRVETWSVPGQDGVGIHLLGKGSGEAVFEAVVFAAQSSLQTWYDSLIALVGTIVTIVDDFGASGSNILIRSVGPLDKSVALAGSTNGRGAAEIMGELLPS